MQKIVAACRREAGKVARAATIAVVDGSGVLMYLGRPDDQPANSVDMATGKARTAAFRERPSSSLEARVKERPGLLTYPNAIAVNRRRAAVLRRAVCRRRRRVGCRRW